MKPLGVGALALMAGSAAGGRAGLVLAAAVAVTGWLVSLYFWPFGPCWRCKGRGTNPGSSRKRFGDCKGCGGTRRRQRLGSRAVHKAVRGTADAARNRKR